MRYTFFGKRVFDAIVDLPFALPTAVSGIALTTGGWWRGGRGGEATWEGGGGGRVGTGEGGGRVG